MGNEERITFDAAAHIEPHRIYVTSIAENCWTTPAHADL
jgi:hypothetical protein